MNAAAAIAAGLLQLSAVSDILLVPIPPLDPADEKLIETFSKLEFHLFRLLAIVDDELVAEYGGRCLDPRSIPEADDSIDSWPGGRCETHGELALAVLGTDLKSFCASLDTDETVRAAAARTITKGTIEIILLPAGWNQGIPLTFPLTGQDVAQYIFENGLVFDPETCAFIPPR